MASPNDNVTHRSGRLRAVPHLQGASAAPEDQPTGGINWPFGPPGQSAALFVPSSMPDTAVPLVVLLHGAGSNATRILPIVAEAAEEQAFLVLAPQSLDTTWDVIRGGFGPDVAALDQALAFVFDAYPVNPDRIAVAGFSDGASYALSLGLVNGVLFSQIWAFSPGFVVPGPALGRPSIFISHGLADQVLPIDRTSRRIVPALKAEGYTVDYREFDGGHSVPPELARAALQRL
jgi:phospholipase/carboxylesterase